MAGAKQKDVTEVVEMIRNYLTLREEALRER